MSESDFDQNVRVSNTFLATLDAALDKANDLLSTDASVAATRDALREQCRLAFAALPVGVEQRRNDEFRKRAERAMRQQLGTMDDTRTEDAGAFRAWLDVASLHRARATPEARGDDAVLAFELTAFRPSAELVDAMADDERQRFSRTREDLRVAAQAHDLTTVMLLTEQQLVAIAARRETMATEPIDEAERPRLVESMFDEQRELERQKLAPAERGARAQMARLLYEQAPRISAPFMVAATHYGTMHSGAQPSSMPVAVLPQRGALLMPLLEWRELPPDALERIGALLVDDELLLVDQENLADLYDNDAVRALAAAGGVEIDERVPAATFGSALAGWNLESETNNSEQRATLAVLAMQAQETVLVAQADEKPLNYSVAAHRKAALALRTLQWIAQLVYLASCSGTLFVHTEALYDYETEQWTALKTRLRVLSYTLDDQLGALAYERLLRALALEVRHTYADDVRAAAAAYTRLAELVVTLSHHVLDSRRVTTAYGAIAADALEYVLPTLADERRDFFHALIFATDSALRTVVRFDARCAALLVVAAAQARGASIDAGGVRRGINEQLLADTLHAALDVDAALAFRVALPIVASQSALLTRYAK